MRTYDDDLNIFIANYRDQNKFARSVDISSRINSVLENFRLHEEKEGAILRNSFQSILTLS